MIILVSRAELRLLGSLISAFNMLTLPPNLKSQHLEEGRIGDLKAKTQSRTAVQAVV